LHYLANNELAPVAIQGAVEGSTDEAVLRRLVDEIGCWQGAVYGKQGKQFLRTRVDAYNAAAQYSPWVMLVDLDAGHNCAPELRNEWLPKTAPNMCFSIVVRALEAWLLADPERFSDFFHVARRKIPLDVESLPQPKVTLVNLSGQSRRMEIRKDMVPRPGSGRLVGPAYTSRIVEFASDRDQGWRPSVAAQNAPSLNRCLNCMRGFASGNVLCTS
jgi:hypothetical protein